MVDGRHARLGLEKVVVDNVEPDHRDGAREEAALRR
jgi:hypothetical protein